MDKKGYPRIEMASIRGFFVVKTKILTVHERLGFFLSTI